MFQSPLHLKDSLDFDHADLVGASVRATNMLRLLSSMRRQAWLFTVIFLTVAAIGAIYALTATPLYTATANIMIDNRQLRSVHDVSTLSDPPMVDVPEIVETQVEVLRSQKVGLAVIKNLDLRTDDPAFTKPGWFDRTLGAAVTKLQAMFGSASPSAALSRSDEEFRRQLAVLRKLNANLRVNRVGHTFVLEVEYISPSPSRAAEIANAYANAFMVEQLNLGIESARRARSWLQQRSQELRQSSIDADLAVQKFKADNNLLSTKEGTLASEQRFNEMMSQLVTARAATAQAKARYDRIKSILDTHQTEAAVAESLVSPVINELRTKYLDAARRKGELERKLGPDHIVIVNLKHTMEEYSSLLFQEFGRVAETYRSDYEVAEAREKALTDEVTREQKVAIAANADLVQLRQLEQKAESYKTLYQTFLQRLQETAQQETFPLAEAHIISAASPPLQASHPRTTLVLAISMALGVLAGASVAVLREFTDYVFRTTEQVRADLGVDALGLLPDVPNAIPQKGSPSRNSPITRYAIDNPLSPFAETLRLAKVAADLALADRSPKVIGLASLLPKEGKTTVAANFAGLLASQGERTLLIDADTRNPTLTRVMMGESGKGLQGECFALPLPGGAVAYEPQSGLHILPYTAAKSDARIAQGFSPEMLQTLLQNCGQAFDYVVIDLPPIGPVADVRSLLPAIDAFIFVIEWGATSRGAVRAALAKERSITDKLVGVILNKVNMKKLRAYEHFGTGGYYRRHYEKYYKQSG
jgi:succinoglycan biosynthesis transport protein ExoP